MFRLFSNLGRFRFTQQKNYYQLLGIEYNATEQEIKLKFHELAKMYHPDGSNASSKNEELFKQISEAYRTLTNQESRIQYDRHLKETNQYTKPRSQQNYQNNNTEYRYPKNPQQPIYDFDIEKAQKYQEKQMGFGDGLFYSMKQAPELYIFSIALLVFFAAIFRELLIATKNNTVVSYPDDPEFLMEKEKHLEKRFGKGSFKKQMLKVTERECKIIPIDVLIQMEEMGRYILPDLCYERIDEYRSKTGSFIEIEVPNQNLEGADIFKRVKKGLGQSRLSSKNINLLEQD